MFKVQCSKFNVKMRKRFRKAKQRRDEKIARHTAGLLSKLLEKARLRERIDKANRLAVSHRTGTLCWTVGLLSFFLAIGVVMTVNDFNRSREEAQQADALHLDGIANVRPMFDGFHRIQNAKDYQNGQVNGMIGDGQRLKRDLDSLVAMPYKTHDDSAKIIIKYHQLEYIVKQIKKEKHETE